MGTTASSPSLDSLSPAYTEGLQVVPTAKSVGPSFDSVYEQYAPFVWRSVRRLGIPQSAVEDVVQDTFIVVHRRLAEEDRTSLKGWLYSIVVWVVRRYRRTAVRKGSVIQSASTALDCNPDEMIDTRAVSPLEAAERAQTVRLVYQLLDELNEERREVFVLAELEQLTAPEIAEALQVNLNTVYWRIRTARHEFEEALTRHRAREQNKKRSL